MSTKDILHAITGGCVLTPLERYEPGTVIVKNDKIAHVGPEASTEIPYGAQIHDARGLLVTPGFFDAHVHGYGGSLFSCANRAQMLEIADGFLCTGVTTFFAALGSIGVSTLDGLKHAVLRCCDAITLWPRSKPEMAGVYLEGPYLSPERAGASRPFFDIRETAGCLEFVCELLCRTRGFVRVIVVAPELCGAQTVIEHALKNDVKVAIGHTDADYGTAKDAIRLWGASHITHTFNAMRGIHHRDPGAALAALLMDEATAEIIADGVHVHPDVIRLLLKTKPLDRVILVTDGGGLTNLADGRYALGDTGVYANLSGGVCTLLDGTLAGSAVGMNEQIRALVEHSGVPLAHAVRLASLNPAKAFGFSDRGSLCAGKLADIVLMDERFDVKKVIKSGIPMTPNR